MTAIVATAFGHYVLWIVFALMAISAVGLGVLSIRLHPSSLLRDRMHHYITFAILTIAAIAYYSMATSQGQLGVHVIHRHFLREVYYARYIDWVFTTPLLLLDLVLLGEVTFHHTARIIFFDILMIVTGLFGALEPSNYRWGWFAMGCVFLALIVWDLFVGIKAKVLERSSALSTIYHSFSIYLIVLWILYPIVWGLSEGSSTFTVNTEILLYGILDVLAKGVFGWAFIFSLPKYTSKRDSDDGLEPEGPFRGGPEGGPFRGGSDGGPYRGGPQAPLLGTSHQTEP